MRHLKLFEGYLDKSLISEFPDWHSFISEFDNREFDEIGLRDRKRIGFIGSALYSDSEIKIENSWTPDQNGLVGKEVHAVISDLEDENDFTELWKFQDGWWIVAHHRDSWNQPNRWWLVPEEEFEKIPDLIWE